VSMAGSSIGGLEAAEKCLCAVRLTAGCFCSAMVADWGSALSASFSFLAALCMVLCRLFGACASHGIAPHCVSSVGYACILRLPFMVGVTSGQLSSARSKLFGVLFDRDGGRCRYLYISGQPMLDVCCGP